MKRRTVYFMISVCVAGLVANASAARGGRYDQQISSATLKVVGSRSEYQSVKATVEDGIVTLTGSVELESSRRGIEVKVRRIANVAGVRNELILDPPAIPDHILFSRLQRRLIDAGFEEINISGHNGEVVLRGAVRSPKDEFSVIQIAWATDGVKEVNPRIFLAQ